MVVCPWVKSHVNIQVAAPLPRGVCPTEPGRQEGEAGRLAVESVPFGSFFLHLAGLSCVVLLQSLRKIHQVVTIQWLTQTQRQ